ncbi:GNAT family N-acetyltransferase [Tenggerimyces flavus]|uniref:GNAT family N-acetyltransferase n=1 Tax=Tenggerimyces flavus TaxID=1708749 RepID=A0ABV7YN70_9ACTN|nr:GNAT family N-acetyltransferase [Tenggerimyces flavus]MBM7788751.1 GNAT superfamily N-acetyltransferase [Tenggerimyces flavus]
MLIRPLRESDLPDVLDVVYRSMSVVRARIAIAAGTAPPDPDAAPPAGWPERWSAQILHLLGTDPGGAWVAEDGDVFGVGLALVRDKLWGLSAYFVRPDRQGTGAGAALMEPLLEYSRGCLRGIIVSTEDPRAARRYRLAGFTLHPTMRSSGVVRREVLPVVDGVRLGGIGDRDLCDSSDRRTRGAAHGPDHDFLSERYQLLVCDTLTGSGYCYVDKDGSPIQLAASTKKVAQRLLWSALALSPPGATVHVNHLTAAQEWAVDVVLAAGLSVRTEGYLALRHMRPPEPYIPSPAFL